MVSKSQISLAGEFAVLSQLSLRGYDANLTLGTAKGVDILVAEPETKRMFKIEVKTSPYKESRERFVGEGIFLYWVMKRRHGEEPPDPNLFYCMVSIQEDNSFRYFVIPSKIVRDYIKLEYEKYLEFNPHITPKETHFRKFRLSLDSHKKYNFIQPLAQDYEDNWLHLNAM